MYDYMYDLHINYKIAFFCLQFTERKVVIIISRATVKNELSGSEVHIRRKDRHQAPKDLHIQVACTYSFANSSLPGHRFFPEGVRNATRVVIC